MLGWMLRWRAAEWDKTFGAHLTSDGSLRFFAGELWQMNLLGGRP